MIDLSGPGREPPSPARHRLAADEVSERLTSGGGTVVDHATRQGGDRRTISAIFPLASDAVHAVVELLRSPSGGPPPTGGDEETSAVRPVRAVLCTGYGDHDGGDSDGEMAPSDRVVARADDLLRLAGPGQILTTASTAVVVSPGLPPGSELIDRGTERLGHDPPERVYELRVRQPGQPQDDDGVASNLAWARRAAPGPVVGRDDDLSALEAAWTATLRGQRQMVLLTGEAGIGKTTVAALFALRVHARGALVLYGRYDQDRIAPYQAIREALGTHANACTPERLRTELAGSVSEVARLLPEVGARVGGVDHERPADPEWDRLLLFEGIVRWLEQIATRQPTLLVLDDVHWADDVSRALLDHVRHAPVKIPLMVVVTGREGENPGEDEANEPGTPSRLLLPESGHGTETLRIPLTGLDTASVRQLVEHALGRPTVAGPAATGDVAKVTGVPEVPDVTAIAETLARDTAGNPLFVQQVLRDLPDDVDHAATLVAVQRASAQGLVDVVRWRLEQLPTKTAEVLLTAAIIGPQFDLDLLAEAVGSPPLTVEDPLDHALREGLLRHEGADQHGAHYRFVHDIVRQALREGMEGERRAVLHRRIGAGLAARAEAEPGVRPEEVAHHYLQAVGRDVDRHVDRDTVRAAVRWAREAAAVAARETAFETAVDLLTRAIEAHDRYAPDSADEVALGCELRHELAEAHDCAGQFGARDRRHLEAAAIARELGRDDLLVRAALGLGGRAPAVSPPDAATSSLLGEAIGRISDRDSRATALLLARRTQIQQMEYPHEQRRAALDRALAIGRDLDDPAALARILTSRAVCLDGPDDYEEHLSLGAEIEDIGHRTGDRELVLVGARVRIPALLVHGRYEEARQLTASFAELARELRHPGHLAIASMLGVLWAIVEGDYERGEAEAEGLRAELRAAGHADSTLVHFGQTVALRWLRGGLASVRPELDVLRAATPDTPIWWAASAYIDVESGRTDRALRQLARQDPADFLGRVDKDFLWWPTLTACAVAAAAGDRAWAAVLHETMSPYTGQNCIFGYSAFAGAVDHYLGTLALTLDRYDQAVEQLQAGMEQHEALGATPFVALSARWLGHALARRARPGDEPRVAALTQHSDTLADRLGLYGLPRFAGEAN